MNTQDENYEELRRNITKTYEKHSWNQSFEAHAIMLLQKCVLVSIEEEVILHDLSFWSDGIAILVVATCGVLLNVPVILFFITRKNLKNLFNET